MNEDGRFIGAVLAGGRSTRFGSDKALAMLEGERLLDRAVGVLGRVCSEVVVVSSRAEHDGPGWERVVDRRSGMGPLAGIEAALAHAADVGATGIVVLACDLPDVGAATVRRLLVELGDGEAVALERDGPPGFEPLCAVYRTRCGEAAARLLDEGARGAHRLLTTMQGRIVRGSAPAPVNVNTREDLARIVRTQSDEPRPRSGRDDVSAGLPGDSATGSTIEAATGPTVVCVVGKKKSGKTTTVVGLVAELARRGHDVMTVKHGHGFDLDREGSDSWKHRHVGGASRVVLAGPDEFAVMGRWSIGDGGERPLEDLVRRYLDDADIVIAEGFKASGFHRIEVFRRAAHADPLLGRPQGGDPERYLAVLTDDPSFRAPCPTWDVDDPERFVRLAEAVEALHGRRSRERVR